MASGGRTTRASCRRRLSDRADDEFRADSRCIPGVAVSRRLTAPPPLIRPRLAYTPAQMDDRAELKALDRSRWRVAISLTALMMAVYFGFILLVAYRKPLL